MERFARVFVVLAVAVTVSGCVTERDAYLSGPLHVRVLNSRTLKPVADADVIIRSRDDPGVYHEAVSGPNGFAALTPLRGSFTALPLANPPADALTVEAKGYKVYTAEVPDSGRAGSEDYYYHFSDLNPPPDAILLKRKS